MAMSIRSQALSRVLLGLLLAVSLAGMMPQQADASSKRPPLSPPQVLKSLPPPPPPPADISPPHPANVALGKPATQLGNNRPQTLNPASWCTNGNEEDLCSTADNGADSPWWVVDLGANYDISKVTIFNRAGCARWACLDSVQNIQIRVGYAPMGGYTMPIPGGYSEDPSVSGRANGLCRNCTAPFSCNRATEINWRRGFPEPKPGMEHNPEKKTTMNDGCGSNCPADFKLRFHSITCDRTLSGRYVSVQAVNNKQPLEMAEVKVWGTPSISPGPPAPRAYIGKLGPKSSR